MSPKFALLLTAFMVFVAYACNDGVFLLPVFASLAYGTMSGVGRWQCSKGVFVALLCLSALAGVTIVRVGSGSIPLNMLVVYILVSALLSMAGAKLHPAYAVALLPVALAEARYMYVLSVLAWALLLVSLCWNRFPNRAVGNEISNGQKRMVLYLLKAVCFFPLMLMSVVFTNPSFLLPALWYVFADFFDEQGRGVTVPQVAQLLFSVLLGAVADYMATCFLENMDLTNGGVAPAAVYAVFALLALLLFYRLSDLRVFVPALTFIVFPFLRDGETSYVLAADFSIVYLVVSSFLFRRLRDKNGL